MRTTRGAYAYKTEENALAEMSLIICCYRAVLPLLFARRFDKKWSRINLLMVQLSRNSGDSLKRRFFTAFVILPFSIKNVPSRVRPV